MGLNASADTIGGWQNHFARLERWKERVLSAMDDPKTYSFHDANDFALAYFVWCHSLAEWLIESGAVQKTDLHDELNVYPKWAICRDIANRSRHFNLTQNPRDKDWSIGREHDLWAKLEKRPERHVLFLVSGNEKYNVEDFVNSTFQMWKQVIEKLGQLK